MTIIEFLLARIADDEAVAQAAAMDCPGPWTEDHGGTNYEYNSGQIGSDGPYSPVSNGYGSQDHGGVQFHSVADQIVTFQPARILAECKAKRAIVGQMWDMHEDYSHLNEAVRHLAAVYADHPDYQQEWAL